MSFDKMFRKLLVFVFMLNWINGDCIYAQWKTTCQKYCMNNQFYEIQSKVCSI